MNFKIEIVFIKFLNDFGARKFLHILLSVNLATFYFKRHF